MPKILRNQVICHKCRELIESRDRHDFKWCTCKNVAVDGGHDYLKRCFKTGKTAGWTDVSIVDNSMDCPRMENCSYYTINRKCSGTLEMFHKCTVFDRPFKAKKSKKK